MGRLSRAQRCNRPIQTFCWLLFPAGKTYITNLKWQASLTISSQKSPMNQKRMNSIKCLIPCHFIYFTSSSFVFLYSVACTREPDINTPDILVQIYLITHYITTGTDIIYNNHTVLIRLKSRVVRNKKLV